MRNHSREVARDILNLVADGLRTWLHTGEMPGDTLDAATAIVADALTEATQDVINDYYANKDR